MYAMHLVITNEMKCKALICIYFVSISEWTLQYSIERSEGLSHTCLIKPAVTAVNKSCCCNQVNI